MFTLVSQLILMFMIHLCTLHSAFAVAGNESQTVEAAEGRAAWIAVSSTLKAKVRVVL